jgi:hypothetical protein
MESYAKFHRKDIDDLKAVAMAALELKKFRARKCTVDDVFPMQDSAADLCC